MDLRHSTIVRAKDQVSTDLGGEVVILAFTSGEYYELQDVGARIWELIQEPKTVQEILGMLLSEYDVDAERCTGDLLALLQHLAAEGLIEVSDAATP